MYKRQERIDRHLGGVWMASLAPLLDNADIVPAIVEALRIPPLPGDDPRQTLISFLRPRNALSVSYTHLTLPTSDLV